MTGLELYEDDLRAIIKALQKLPDLAGIEGLYGVSVEVSFEDGTEVTIGYGESGDACVKSIYRRYPAPAAARQEAPSDARSQP